MARTNVSIELLKRRDMSAHSNDARQVPPLSRNLSDLANCISAAKDSVDERES